MSGTEQTLNVHLTNSLINGIAAKLASYRTTQFKKPIIDYINFQ
jgi:hypothetical protein